MLIVVLGQTAAGKDSVARGLINMGYQKVVSHTTRPMRANEVEGKDYYFHESFDEAKDAFNQRVYHTTKGDWYYWFEREDIMNAINSAEVYITIADVPGTRLLESIGAVPIYIYSTLYERMVRYYNRESKNENPDYKEVLRRLIADGKDFAEFEFEALNGQHITVCNDDDLLKTIRLVNNKIKEMTTDGC